MKKIFFDIFSRIFIVTLAVALSLSVCEILARIFHLSKTYSSYPCLVNENLITGYSPNRNTHGWRDREFTKTKNVNTYRIACIGDSVTEGYRIALESVFSKVLERELTGLGYNIEVMNLGIAGNNASRNLAAFNTAAEFSTDLIIYQFGLNDIEGLEHFEERSIADAPLAKDKRLIKNRNFDLKPLLRKSVFYLALAERYNYIRLRLGIKTWAFDEWKVTEAMWKKDLARMKKAFDAVKSRIEICIIYMPYDYEVYSAREEAFKSSKRISEFCKDNGLYFLDFTKIFKDQRDRYGIFLDDCHLSDKGHKIVAEYLKDFILHDII